MKISSQSIRWLGNNHVEVSTTRSKTKSGSYFRLGWFSISTPSSHRSSTVTEVVGMDRERFKVEKERIKRGRFRDYDSEKYYEYDEDAAYLPEEQYQEIIENVVNAARVAVGYAQNARKWWENNDRSLRQIIADYDADESDADDMVVGVLGLFVIAVAVLMLLSAGWIVGLSFGVIGILVIGGVQSWADEYEGTNTPSNGVDRDPDPAKD